MNSCVFTVQVPRDVRGKTFNPAQGDRKAKLFIPLLHKQYMGPEKDTKWTSIPCVFFDGRAESFNKTLVPGMRLTIRAKFNSYYDKEADKEHISFVVDEADITHWPNEGAEFTDDVGDFEDVDEDEFPF